MFEYLGPNSPIEVLKLCGRKGFVNIALKTGNFVVIFTISLFLSLNKYE